MTGFTVPAPAASAPDTALRRRLYIGIFVTGFSLVLYATVWSIDFTILFGGRGPTTAVFMAALLLAIAGGAALAARRVTRLTRPVRAFAFTHFAAGIAAVATPMVFAALDGGYSAALGGGLSMSNPPAWLGVAQLLLGWLAFGVPTAALGASLPVAARALALPAAGIGTTPAQFSGIAAAGASVGAVAMCYGLISVLGLLGTTGLAFAGNLTAFGLLVRNRNAQGDEADAGTTIEDRQSRRGFFASCIRPWLFRRPLTSGDLLATLRRQPMWILPVAFVTGATAAAYAVLWIRLLAQRSGEDVESQAAFAAVAFVSFASGSCLVAWWPNRSLRAAAGLSWAQLGIGIVSILIYILLVPLIPASAAGRTLVIYLAAAIAPTGALFGAAVPLSLCALSNRSDIDAGDLGRAGCWGALGAAGGVCVAGIWLLPTRGFGGLLEIAALCNVALSVWIAAVIAKPRPFVITAMIVAFLAVSFGVSLPRPGVGAEPRDVAMPGGAEERFYAVGRSETVRVTETGDGFELYRDGRLVSAIAASGSPPALNSERWLAALAVTARPEARTLLLLGLGSGVALEGVPASIRQIDVVEPERQILVANTLIGPSRTVDRLGDDRVALYVDDPRHALRRTTARYDVVVSQPMSARTRSGAAVHTREYFAAVGAHLTDGGVLVQSVPADSNDTRGLRALAATIVHEFEYVRLYRTANADLAILASARPLDPELQLARSGKPITDDVMHFSRMGLNSVEDLLIALVADETQLTELAGDAPVVSDQSLLATSRARDGDAADVDALAAPYDVLATRGSWIYSSIADRIDFGYVGRRLIASDHQERALAISQAQSEASNRLVVLGLLYDDRGERGQAEAAYRAALAQRPDNVQARYLLIEPRIAQLAHETAEPEFAQIAASLPPSATAIIQGWRFASEQNWESLAQLDSLLGRAAITDAWYPEAVRLRAQWRSKVTENLATIAFDALRLVDRALSIEPDQNLLLLRAAIGIALMDAGIAVESSRLVVRGIRADLENAQAADGRIAGRELLIMRQNLTAIVANLRGELVAGSPRRAEEVRQQANQILRYIDAATATEEQ